MTDYDVRSIFEQMELELIASMRRNLSKHQKWEKDEKINWTMWQAEQLKTLENFKKENEKIFGARFTGINNAIADFLKENANTAGFEQERLILEQLAKGNKVNWDVKESLSGGFFSLNEKKMNALINATVSDMKKAEHAMLRMVNNQYRKTIFRAQIMANSGAFTLKQSIDAATKDFLKAGINCIEYKDGRRVNIATYAEMAVRTANKRAVLQSEGEARNAYGVHTVRISKYGGCSETCLPWQGKVYVDDIWSGGTKEEANEKKFPLLSEAIEGGLFHPNCKHRATTYFPELEEAVEDIDDSGFENPLEEQEHRKNQLHIQQQERLETGSLDSKNVAEAKQKKMFYQDKDFLLFKDMFIKSVRNTDAVVEKYYSIFNVTSHSKEFDDLIKEELRIIPEKDLAVIAKFGISIHESYSESSYDELLKVLVLNKDDYVPGILAHEFAHCAVANNKLYADSEMENILKEVFDTRDRIVSVKVNGEKYIYIKSDRFVRQYQGRTYVLLDDYYKNPSSLTYMNLEEYISVGYETFVSNPKLLYNKDRKLYEYFKKRGLDK